MGLGHSQIKGGQEKKDTLYVGRKRNLSQFLFSLLVSDKLSLKAFASVEQFLVHIDLSFLPGSLVVLWM